MFTSEFAIRFMVSAVSAKSLLKFWIAVSVSAVMCFSSVALLGALLYVPAGSSVRRIAAPHEHVSRRAIVLEAAVQLAAVLVLADEGREGGAERDHLYRTLGARPIASAGRVMSRRASIGRF
jgi:hypothetical protein